MPPNEPHLIYGKVTGTGSANATIVLDNLTTNESIETTTDSAGNYVFDCANFPNGYSNGDSINIRISSGTLIAERLNAGIDKTSLFQIHNIDKIQVI